MLRKARVTYNRLRGYASVGSVRLPIDRTVLSPGTEKRLASGKHETCVAEAAKHLIRDGDVVVELGAGLGYISAYLRRQTGAGRIVAYEANPDLVAYIRNVHRCSKAHDIEVRHAVVLPAVSATTLPFYLRNNFSASSLCETDGPVVRTVPVPVANWNDMLGEVKPSAVIMDIEGGELDLLEADDFGPIRRLVVETHPAIYGTPGMKRLYDALAKHGFQYRSLYHVKESTAPVLTLER